MMKSIFLMLLLGLAACGLKHTTVDYGRMTVSELVAIKGDPLSEETIPSSPGSKVFIYENNQKYQINGDIVSHGFRSPSGDEKLLLYWKHKFRDCDTKVRKISQDESHLAPIYEIKCPSEGLSVIYKEDSEFASRIVENEKQ
jgi:hypothetical protein